MKHSKTTKKLSSKLDTVLEKIKTLSNEEFTSFIDLSFTVQFDQFPGSLLVTCQFKNDENFDTVKAKENTYQKTLHKLLFKQGIVLKNPSQNLAFTKSDSL